MAYQVIARRWRPQTFSEVVYQEHVSKTIGNSIKSGRISHAYLFAGPRGVGKTSMARIVAKALNCGQGPTDAPCGKCESCLEIKEGNSFDVIEIDGASNRGIENIRELRENVNFAPVKSTYKVYIVDEVHMLTKEAFNALLKTLEEPPPHIVFIFATTEIHKIPETILSRCQKYFFKKISVDVIVSHLKQIVDSEGYNLDEKFLYPIARAADGSMRDAQSLLDQIISFSEEDMREEDTLSILGVVPFESYMQLLKFISSIDPKSAITEIDRIVSLGVDIPRFIGGLIDVLRAIRLFINDIAVDSVLSLSEQEVELLRAAREGYNDEELSVLFQIASDCIQDLRFSSNERVNLEMAVLDMISAKKRPSISSILKKLDDYQGKAGEKPQVGSAGMNERKKEDQNKTEIQFSGETKNRLQDDSEKKETITGDMWNSLLKDMKEANKKFLYEKLAMARMSYSDNIVHILYPKTDEHSYYRRILDNKDIDYLKNEIAARTGEKVAIEIGEHDEVATEDSHPEHKMPPDEAVMVQGPELDEMKKINPTVEKVKDMFQGKIIEKGEK